MKESQVTFLDIKQLQINPFQPREKVVDDGNFVELMESIRVQGILEPLVVVDTPAGYQIIAGERRFRAAKKIGMEKIPVHLVQTTPKGMLEMAVTENIQRVDLSPIERAQALKRLMQEFGMDAKKLSERMGKSEVYVLQSLRLLTLPDPVKDGLNEGLINESVARAILMAGDDKSMIDCYRQVVKEGASSMRATTLARFFKEKARAAEEGKTIKKSKTIDYRSQLWQSYLQDKLKTKATLNMTSSNKSSRIVIVLHGNKEEREKDLERIMKITGVDIKKMDEEEKG